MDHCTLETDADNYTLNAVSAIRILNEKWYSSNSGLWDSAWWNSANALTTLVDFASLRPGEASQLNIDGYIKNTFTQAQKPSEGGFEGFINEFYDDQGWWALALIRVYDITGESHYLDKAITIFQDMDTAKGGPCNGGLFWDRDRKYVNAITNELYLSLAASLANRVPSDPTYLRIAESQWEWFKGSSMINSDNLINDGLDDQCRNNGFQTWSYNQGVILGGLSELAKATSNAALLDEAKVIAHAAIEHLSNSRGVIVETDACELREGHCGCDGQQFKGVFIRNLRYLYEQCPDPKFRECILTNADIIWADNRSGEAMLGVAWNGPFVLATGPSQSAALDVLVAAIAVA